MPILQTSYQNNLMQDNPTSLKVNMDWVKSDSDQSLCDKCKMMIVSKDMWQIVVFVDYEPIETRFKYCESCYDKSME